MENPHHTIHSDDTLLAKFKVFTELSREELDALIEQSSRVSHRAGDRIITAGEAGFCMFVILSGSTRVTSPGNGADEIELAVLRAGDFFGEVALVDDGPRSANVTALEDCELLCITRMTLGVLAGLQPGAAIQLLAAIGRCLVQRIREGNQKYMDLILLGRQSA